MTASLTIIGPMRLPPAVIDLMRREAANARSAILHRMERMDKIFHLVEEDNVRDWLGDELPRIGVQVESLLDFYVSSGPNIGELHLEVAEWVMQAPRLGLATGVIFSGRAELCVPPSTALNTLALAADIPVTVLPHVFALPSNGEHPSNQQQARR